MFNISCSSIWALTRVLFVSIVYSLIHRSRGFQKLHRSIEKLVPPVHRSQYPRDPFGLLRWKLPALQYIKCLGKSGKYAKKSKANVFEHFPHFATGYILAIGYQGCSSRATRCPLLHDLLNQMAFLLLPSKITSVIKTDHELWDRPYVHQLQFCIESIQKSTE
jgi:hypothetical protein